MDDRVLGLGLILVGGVLGVVALAWLAVNAAAGILQPGGFVLGLFFLLLFILPLIVAGFWVLRRGAARETTSARFEERRRTLERDRIFRQSLLVQVQRAADLVERRADEVAGEAGGDLRRAGSILKGLSAEVAQPVAEVDWLSARSLTSDDTRDVERYDDLLLAGLRRIREETQQPMGTGETGLARRILELARSAERQFALRQDLLLRGRKLPRVSPLQLLGGGIEDRGQVEPESLGPGGAVSYGSDNYLVTAHITYFAEGRTWHTLVLRGEDGERRLQIEPGATQALMMKPLPPGSLSGATEASGTASVSVDSLSGSAEGVVVDYRRTREGDGQSGWWERWPEGERAFSGEQMSVHGLKFWPAAVGGESA
jgi:hypothetical protein